MGARIIQIVANTVTYVVIGSAKNDDIFCF